jgi:DNA polymerase III sliding clamp (beta) subunit (PCNA family)
VQQNGAITVPGRKLLDIFRALPERTTVTLTITAAAPHFCDPYEAAVKVQAAPKLIA